jgi:mannose-1-phosphate guanylyltransferase
MSKRYALILAGGSGERFWPLSRKTAPKQLLNLFGGETMLEATISRLEGLLPAENILILTNVDQEASVRKVLGDRLPAENIVAEPAKRDTAPAIALAVGWVAARDPDASMAVLPADQLIQDQGAFEDVLNAAFDAAEAEEAVVTIGVKPTWPCPSYGYIERGAAVSAEGKPAVYSVERFREKPDPATAQSFLDAGNFSWNAGMFIWSLTTVQRAFEKHVPALAEFVERVRTCDDLDALLAAEFASLEKVSIDFALMEKADKVLNVEATFDWDDVGSWISVAKYLDEDAAGNRSNAEITQIDAANNVVYSAKAGSRIALLGVEDLIVVQTGDAVLVAHKDKADEIKKLVAELPGELL